MKQTRKTVASTRNRLKQRAHRKPVSPLSSKTAQPERTQNVIKAKSQVIALVLVALLMGFAAIKVGSVSMIDFSAGVDHLEQVVLRLAIGFGLLLSCVKIVWGELIDLIQEAKRKR